MTPTNKKYLVIGGTNYDTNIGVTLLKKNCAITYGLPLSKNPKEQTYLQANNVKKLESNIVQNIANFHENFDEIVVFCNSLSFALDWNKIQTEVAYPIITLIDSYNKLIINKKAIGLITGNIHTLYKINSFLEKRFRDISIMGFAALPTITQIEQGKIDPINVIDQYLNLCKENQIQDIIIGCTHFENICKNKLDKNLNLIFPGINLIANLNKTTNEKKD